MFTYDYQKQKGSEARYFSKMSQKKLSPGFKRAIRRAIICLVFWTETKSHTHNTASLIHLCLAPWQSLHRVSGRMLVKKKTGST